MQSMHQFATVLSGLNHSQALTFGIPKRGVGGRIVSARRFEKEGSPSGLLQRCREDFEWPASRGVIMFDYDSRPDVDPVSRDALLSALYATCPGMDKAGHIHWLSSSSMIYNLDTNECVSGARGQRVYLVLEDARDIERVAKIVVRRLWIAGHGYIQVSSSGALLERTLIDALVHQPERIDFASGAACEAPLAQDRGAPVIICGGPPLDSRRMVEDLSDAELKLYERAVRAAKAEAKPRAEAARALWIESRAVTLAEEQALSIGDARVVAKDAVERLRLRGNFVLVTCDGIRVTVAEILRDRAAWEGRRFEHPLDPSNPDKRIAVARLGGHGSPYIYCHSGPQKFTLHATAVTVQIQSGGLGEALDQVRAAMVESGMFFARGADVVSLSSEGKLIALQIPALAHMLESVIAFEKWSTTQWNDDHSAKGRYLPCNADPELVLRLRALIGDGALPSVAAVVPHPLIAPDGRVIDTAGYDAGTRLLLVADPRRPWPRVPRAPTVDDVRNAVRTLFAPFAAYPLDGDVSRGVLLSALLTAVVRRVLPTAPGFIVSAPSAGSGKTIMASAIGELAGGGPAQALPNDENEIDKRITAHLRSDAPVLFFDNLVGSPDSPALCRMLTSSTYSGRVLGESRMSGDLPTSTLMVCTGNNIGGGGDLFRRLLRIYVDPQDETPHMRSFAFDPHAMVREKKDEMIVAALTVLVSWTQTSAFRDAKGRIRSFVEWDRLIGQCVNYIDSLEINTDGGRFGDPARAIEEARAADAGAGEFETLMKTWTEGDEKLGLPSACGREVSMAEVFAELERIRDGGIPRDAVCGVVAIAMDKAGAAARSPKGLGKWIAQWENKVVADFALRSRRVNGAKVWRAERVR